MCLNALPIHALADSRKMAAFVTTRNILVWKALCPSLDIDDADAAYSPFMGVRWVFGKAKTAKKMRQTVSEVGFYYYHGVEYGLHAYRTKRVQENQHKGKDRFPAIIPAGSRIWFGSRGDVASTEMIVFKNMLDLEAVYGKVTKPKKYTTLTRKST